MNPAGLSRKKLWLIVGILWTIFIVPILLYVVHQRHEMRKKAAYPFECSASSSQNGFNYTNTFESAKKVRCIEYLNCDCPGSPQGKCDKNSSLVWEKVVGPGETGTCSCSKQPDACKVSQVDLRYANTVENADDWAEAPNCWYILNQCTDCQPTPTIPVTVTPTPTPPVTTPTPMTGCYNECASDSSCRSGLACLEVAGVKRCVNRDCQSESDCACNRNCWEVCGHSSECKADSGCRQIEGIKRCVPNSSSLSCSSEAVCCNLSTPTPTPSGTSATPTNYVAPIIVPESGFIWPTAGAVLGGVVLLILSVL